MKIDYDKAKHTIEKLKGFWESYTKTISKSTCDKYGFGFNRDNRFSMFSVKVSLDSWTGWYGYSGYCEGNLGDRELLEEYFVKWLNKNTERMLSEMAALLEADSQSAKQERIAELKLQLAQLEGNPDKAIENLEVSS